MADFNVIFDSSGGSSVPTQTVTSGDLATEPTNPIKTNYVFAGWYTDEDTLESLFSFSTPIVGNITLYAKWIPINRISFGSQFLRQYVGPLDPDLHFEEDYHAEKSATTVMNEYLTNPRRYAGMIVTCADFENSIFKLNNARDTWIEINPNVQADWDETDPSSAAFINNKPAPTGDATPSSKGIVRLSDKDYYEHLASDSLAITESVLKSILKNGVMSDIEDAIEVLNEFIGE